MQTSGLRDMREFFDDYVKRDFPNRRNEKGETFGWPGDEWANEDLRENTYNLLLSNTDSAPQRHIVEIGPGSGKYTQMLLERTAASLTAFELSPALLEALRQRCGKYIESGRLSARDMNWTKNNELVAAIGSNAGSVDLFFAIDVFLMMDFQAVLIHLISAARVLRVGGRFAATFGDANSASGWGRMLSDASRHSAFELAPDTRFHWLSAGFLEQVLARLGFTILKSVSGPQGGEFGTLDVARRYIVAELTDKEPSAVISYGLWQF